MSTAFWVYFDLVAGVLAMGGGVADIIRDGNWVRGVLMIFIGLGSILRSWRHRQQPEFRVWKKWRLQRRADRIVVHPMDQTILDAFPSFWDDLKAAWRELVHGE